MNKEREAYTLAHLSGVEKLIERLNVRKKKSFLRE